MDILPDEISGTCVCVAWRPKTVSLYINVMSLFFQSLYNARTQTVYTMYSMALITDTGIAFLALNLSKLIVLFSATNIFSEKILYSVSERNNR